MGDPKKKKTPAEELIESLLRDAGESVPDSDDANSDYESETRVDGGTTTEIEGLVLSDGQDKSGFLVSTEASEYSENTVEEYSTKSEESSSYSSVTNDDNKFRTQPDSGALNLSLDENSSKNNLFEAMGAMQADQNKEHQEAGPQAQRAAQSPSFLADSSTSVEDGIKSDNLNKDAHTELMNVNSDPEKENASNNSDFQSSGSDSEKTVAVAGYQMRKEADYDDKVKVSVGQARGASSGYQAWNSGDNAESNLAQAENLRIAQDKILELEDENEKIRLQNEELMAASEIIKERSDLLSSQLNEIKNDREGLESSFKNEVILLKNHLTKKDAELQKAQIKIEELDSRLKFDMKKIRIRERELENRLELIRAEKNAIVKNKDEQILDLRRKMDVLQMEVESYRQKCVELNKSIESSQESFKRTTRALRLAMANLELQDESKTPLKKVD